MKPKFAFKEETADHLNISDWQWGFYIGAGAATAALIIT